MNEEMIPQIICEYLNSAGETVFMPEAWRDGCGAVFLTGERRSTRYVDGSARVTVGFEVAIRSAGRSAADRLKVIRSFARLSDYTNGAELIGGEIVMTGGARMTDSLKDGGAEYRCRFEIRYFTEGSV